ncbi:TetR/AcrR family transcriptional regulator [Sporosarcina sp. FA9]|uniref:TetR/AcrR family transcriptional regulator n=1 Tax=Sporosarcina sp. FA9 TaxID=3413030 RepID=UPI003F65A6C5
MKLSEKKTLAKKEQILLSAITIVNRRGFDGATMEEIAAELLMTKGSLYYYFKSKSDLMYQCHNLVFSKAMEELKSELVDKDSAEEIIRNMISIHIEFAIEEKETFNMLIEPSHVFSGEQLSRVLEVRKEYTSIFDEAIEKGVASGDFNVGDQVIVRMMIMGAMNWIQQWYQPGGRFSKEDVKKHFGDSIMKLLK